MILFAAARCCRLEALVALLKAGAKPDLRVSHGPIEGTCLHVVMWIASVANPPAQFAHALLDAGANPNALDGRGRTSVDVLIAHGDSRDPAKAQEALRAAARTLDRAASKGVLHKKNASRRIARLFAAAQTARA